MLSVPRGAALYVGALIGPGLLLIPALAAQTAGPASILAWLALLVLSAPIAITFGALGVRHPVAGGVSAYTREAFGPDAAAVTGIWFVAAVVLGGPAVALIGGYYVAELTGRGQLTALAVAVAIYAAVLVTNAVGLTVSSAVQLGLSAALVAVVAVAVAVALPGRLADHWSPFAPHGWWAVGTATNILIWLVIGWEAMAQLAGDFRHPARDLPRAMAVAFAVIAVLYTGLGVATIVVPQGRDSTVPLADLIELGFGSAGRSATAVLAVVLTMGTMNVYTGSVCALAGSLAAERALPAWLATGSPGSAGRTTGGVPRRPLVALAVSGAFVLGALAAGTATPAGLVRATAACFIAVCVLALAAATRILSGRLRAAATLALVLSALVALFSAGYLVVPAAAAVLCLGLRRWSRRPGLVPTGPHLRSRHTQISAATSRAPADGGTPGPGEGGGHEPSGRTA
jgi:amino acid efflux transporter